MDYVSFFGKFWCNNESVLKCEYIRSNMNENRDYLMMLKSF